MIKNSYDNPKVIETVLQYCDMKTTIEIIHNVSLAYITDYNQKTRLCRLSKSLKPILKFHNNLNSNTYII